jgi:hypothetical protein
VKGCLEISKATGCLPVQIVDQLKAGGFLGSNSEAYAYIVDLIRQMPEDAEIVSRVDHLPPARIFRMDPSKLSDLEHS